MQHDCILTPGSKCCANTVVHSSTGSWVIITSHHNSMLQSWIVVSISHILVIKLLILMTLLCSRCCITGLLLSAEFICAAYIDAPKIDASVQHIWASLLTEVYTCSVVYCTYVYVICDSKHSYYPEFWLSSVTLFEMYHSPSLKGESWFWVEEYTWICICSS